MTLRRENSWPYRNSNSDLSVMQPVAHHYTNYVIPDSKNGNKLKNEKKRYHGEEYWKPTPYFRKTWKFRGTTRWWPPECETDIVVPHWWYPLYKCPIKKNKLHRYKMHITSSRQSVWTWRKKHCKTSFLGTTQDPSHNCLLDPSIWTTIFKLPSLGKMKTEIFYKMYINHIK
jgi:hypothetical protein